MRRGIPTAPINVPQENCLEHIFLNELPSWKALRRRVTVDDYFGNEIGDASSSQLSSKFKTLGYSYMIARFRIVQFGTLCNHDE
jgi:hypothetical protein